MYEKKKKLSQPTDEDILFFDEDFSKVTLYADEMGMLGAPILDETSVQILDAVHRNINEKSTIFL